MQKKRRERKKDLFAKVNKLAKQDYYFKVK